MKIEKTSSFFYIWLKALFTYTNTLTKVITIYRATKKKKYNFHFAHYIC